MLTQSKAVAAGNLQNLHWDTVPFDLLKDPRELKIHALGKAG